MSVVVREYTLNDLDAIRSIWNSVVEKGNAFPQEDYLNAKKAKQFFEKQSYTGVALDGDKVVGLYILHPNNIGRCGHIANASYAVKEGKRGKQIGKYLVIDSLDKAAALSFRILQFNAVVATNEGAIHLYKKLGFTPLGTIPGGFRIDSNNYVDIIPFYKLIE